MTGISTYAKRLAGIAVAAALLGAAMAGEAAAQLKKVNAGMLPIVNGPIYIAIKEKYFEQLGIELNLVKFQSGPAQFAALAGGQIDLAWGGMGAYSLAKANGQDLNFFTIFMDYNPLQALVVAKGSPIKTVKDLAGKKIATVQGSDGHYGTLRTLQKHGVDPKSAQLLFMAPPQQIAALDKGDVDAMYVWEPFVTPLLEKGGTAISWMPELDPGSSFLGWAGKKAWLEANADTVAKILKGWDMGLKKMKEDPELAVKYTLEQTGMAESQARAIIKGLVHFPSTAAIDPASPAYWAKGSKVNKALVDFQAFGKEVGVIKETINVDDFVMPRIMQLVKDAK